LFIPNVPKPLSCFLYMSMGMQIQFYSRKAKT
jgi:hypothetical protein